MESRVVTSVGQELGRGDIAGNGSRLRETGEVLTNQVTREREDGRHAPPSNERASACAAFGRSGGTGPRTGGAWERTRSLPQK